MVNVWVHEKAIHSPRTDYCRKYLVTMGVHERAAERAKRAPWYESRLDLGSVGGLRVFNFLRGLDAQAAPAETEVSE